MARLAFVEDRYADAEEVFRISVALLHAAGADVHRCFAYRYIGRVAQVRGSDESVPAIGMALELANDLELTGFATVLHTDLAVSLGATGRVAEAREILDRTLRTARELGSLRGIGETLTAMALLEWRAGAHAAAESRAVEAIDLVVATRSCEATIACCGVLGLAAERRGDVDTARVWHRRGLEVGRAWGEPHRIAFSLEGLAGVALLEHDAPQAARLLGAAKALRGLPGRAAGWAFAPCGRPDVEQILADATDSIGADAMSAAFEEGAAVSEVVVAAVSTTPS